MSFEFLMGFAAKVPCAPLLSATNRADRPRLQFALWQRSGGTSAISHFALAMFIGVSLLLGLVQVAHAGMAKKFGYGVLASGERTGAMTVSVMADGAREIAYSFNDRGRGSVVTSQVRVDKALLPTRLSVRGVDYFKKPVDERFERVGGRATWKTGNDAGNAPAGDGFYLPAEWTSEHLAELVRAMLRKPGHVQSLLPTGTATVENLGVHDVVLDGRKQPATLYAISGLDLIPMPLWLDASGELLFEGGAWFATVRTGLEKQVQALLVEQERILTARQIARAATLSQRASGPVAFVGVSLFDAETRSMRPHTTVVVRGNRIEAVGPVDSTPVPADALRIDGRGRTLLPGLWDMHTHVSSNEKGLMHLAAGITSARDLGDPMDDLIQRRDRFDAGQLVGPRLLLAGLIDGPGPLAAPFKVLVSNPDEMRKTIQNYVAHGYVQIKLYSSLDPRLVPVAAAEAHRLGLRLSGHIPAGMTMRQAVEAGYDEVQHMNFVMLNFMGPQINAKTNGMTRFTAVAEHGLDLDLASREVNDFVDLLKRHDTVIDPTLSIFENHFMGRSGKPVPNLAAVIERLPPVVRRGSFGGGLAVDDAQATRNAASFERMLQMLKKLHEAGIRIVPGTDDMEGFTYERELELYVQAGISPLDVLYIATLGSARVMARDKEPGSVAPGKLADLVLVDGAPAERISDIRDIALVMKGGLMFDPAKLYGEVGIAARKESAVKNDRGTEGNSEPVGAKSLQKNPGQQQPATATPLPPSVSTANSVASLQAPPTAATLAAIDATCHDYIDGQLEGNPARVARSLHPELVNRWVRTKMPHKPLELGSESREVLLESTRKGVLKTPVEKWDRTCTVLGVSGDAASIRLATPWWVAFFHLGNFDGKWLIVDGF